MTVGDKIKALRKEARLTQGQLAEKLNATPTAVSAWERNANNPMMDKITLMSDLFKVPVSYFFDSSELIEGASGGVTFRRVPILGSIACGDAILASENIEGFTSEPSTDLPSGTIFALKADGTSMEPTIPNGALVIIREQAVVENGEIAAVLLNGDTEATLKRIKRQGDVLLLVPDNKDYDIIIVDDNNPARVIGKAISVKYKL